MGIKAPLAINPGLMKSLTRAVYSPDCLAGAKTLKDFAIHVCEVNLATNRSLTLPRLTGASPSEISEVSHLIKLGKYYYLLTIEGGTEEGHIEWGSRCEAGLLVPLGNARKGSQQRN
jgi:hypothetical protein